MKTINENAKHILKGYSIKADCYKIAPNGMTKYIRNGREYYIEDDLAHYITEAGYSAA